MNNNLIIALIILTGIVIVSGCNKAKIPGLVRCEGTVTWKGEPVEGAFVAFTPKDDSSGRSAFGTTGAEGKFKATTLDTNDGIMPGAYFVTVSKVVSIRIEGPPSPLEDDSLDKSSRTPAPRSRGQVQDTQDTYFIPQVYANKDTSGLSAEISSKGNKNLRFELVGEIAK